MPAFRAVFMGSGSFSVPVLDRLLLAGPELPTPVTTTAVVTQPDRPAGRGRRMRSNAVAELAKHRGVRVLQPPRVRESQAVEEIAALQPDVIVVAAYGQILPRALLDVPARKSLNLHPSLLPRHRGPAPVVGTILAGDEITGTTLMMMSSRMDAGPIVSQIETPVDSTETAGDLEHRLAELSGDLLLRDLPAWLAGELEAQPQDEASATYTRLLTKEDARLDWSLAADEVARRVRAYNPWPIAHSTWPSQLPEGTSDDDRDRDTGLQLRILHAHALDGASYPGTILGLREGNLLIACGGGVLAAEELQLPGGRPLPAAELLRGHLDLLHARLV